MFVIVGIELSFVKNFSAEKNVKNIGFGSKIDKLIPKTNAKSHHGFTLAAIS